MGTSARVPKIHGRPPRSILSLQDPQQNRNLGTIPICNIALCFPHDNNAQIHLCHEYKKSNESSEVHFVTARASLFTDHRMSGQPIRAKYRRFKTIRELTLDKSPTVSHPSYLNFWSSRHGAETCTVAQPFFIRQFAISFHV